MPDLKAPTEEQVQGFDPKVVNNTQYILKDLIQGDNSVFDGIEDLDGETGLHDVVREAVGDVAVQRRASSVAELMDEHGITVWRCHDYIHSGIPSPVDGTWGSVTILYI